MASTIPQLRLVRCPKCRKVLIEISGISLYKCGGCGASLQAKVGSSSGEILSSASAAGSSKHISDSGSQSNQKENFEKETPSSLDHPEDQDQALTESLKVSGSSGERNVEEASRNGMKTKVSDSYGGNLKEKAKSPVQENNGIKGITMEMENRTEQGIPSKIKNTLNEELKTSFDQEIPAANNSLKSSDKLEESPESLEHDTSSEDNKINGKLRMDSSFLLRSSSHVYEGSESSTDEERKKKIPQKYLELSRRTFGKRTSSVFSGVQARERDFSFVSEDFKSALNWMESEKDTKHFVKLRYNEKDDKVKIIRKVDELKSELLDFFHRSANVKDNSRVGLTAAHFEGKIPPKQYRSSSLIPLSARPNSSCLNPHHGGLCCHNEHCKLCPHKACCRLPESTTKSHLLHMKRCTYHQEPQNLQSNDKKPQQVKRHCRPVSGGAPFVICYRCYKLLQLPADFLVSTKRVHKLRCGSCHEVLRYFFRARSRSMPWTPAEARHPPSEEEKTKVLNDEIRIPVSNGLAGGDPVSYSEDYDISFGKSYSYEAEPSRYLQRYDSIVEEEHSGKEMRSSQLHKLMGYSSARYLLFETLSPGEGYRIGHDR